MSMRDTGLTAEPTIPLADRAVKYLLDRVQHDPDLRYYCGPGTQAWHLLCWAEAARTGEPIEKVEAERARDLQPDYDRRKPRVVELETELKSLRTKLEDFRGKRTG
jgi:hypothetical protein